MARGHVNMNGVREGHGPDGWIFGHGTSAIGRRKAEAMTRMADKRADNECIMNMWSGVRRGKYGAEADR
jgi:hypothetical protein